MNPIFDITSFGARGDGRTVNTAAIQAAAAACRESGGTILVPAGDFVTERFEIFSDTVLHVEAGGELIADPWCGAVLFAADARNIVLTGGGIVDGNADMLRTKKGATFPGRVEPVLAFTRCANVTVEEIALIGAAARAMDCEGCERVSVRGVDVLNRITHPDSDGLRFQSCLGVRVEACCFVCGENATAISEFGGTANQAEIVLGFREITLTGEAVRMRGCHLSRLPSGNGAVRMAAPVISVCKRTRRARHSDSNGAAEEECKADPSLFRGNWWGRGEPIPISTAMRTGQ